MQAIKIHLTADVLANLREYREASGISVSAQIKQAVQDMLAKREPSRQSLADRSSPRLPDARPDPPASDVQAPAVAQADADEPIAPTAPAQTGTLWSAKP